jgi:DNA primase
MDFSLETLRAQRDDAQRDWLANPYDPSAWSRLIKYNELIKRAEAGEAGDDV